MRAERDVSADTAIRLARYFRTDSRFWLNLQAAHDISKAQTENDYSKVSQERRRDNAISLRRYALV